jgi:epoxyqueuosine reductase
MTSNPHQLAAEIKQFARQIGFDLVGIASAEPSHYRDYLRQWLDDGKAGTMDYLKTRFAERVDPRQYVPSAASVICVAMNYHVPLEAESAAVDEPRGHIARYALGDDYHEVIKQRLWQLSDWLRQRVDGVITRACVDTAPVMEKELASRAGLGWMGKNTCIINPQIGSWILLGEIITNIELPVDEPQLDRCGTCRRCLDACPTQAITEPYKLDARRCISYLTIEQRQEIAEEFRPSLGSWLYGCDICQEVCPWNHKAPFTDEPAFAPRFADGQIDLQTLLGWKADDYTRTLKGSAMKRVKLQVLQRNAQTILENQKQASR